MGYVLGIDFDGTCVTHEFPYIGDMIGAEIVLKALQDIGWRFILITMRSHEQTGEFSFDPLDRAVSWFRVKGIRLYGVNENPDQSEWSKSRKIYANLYIDDQFLGCPTKQGPNGRLFVDWLGVTEELEKRSFISTSLANGLKSRLKMEYPTLYS